MPNNPFRFLDSPATLGLLRQALGQIGLSEQKTVKQPMPGEEETAPNPYYPACLLFACRWLSSPVEVHLHYDWWPDGMNSELARVSVVFEGDVCGEVNVRELLRKRLARPLADVVIEGIVVLCAKLVGTRKGASKS